MDALDSMDHVGIVVANLDAAIKWYQTSFACELLYQDKKEALLQFANVKLALTLPSYHPPHLAFEKKDAATYGELHKQADGRLSTIVGDPTGNIVELIAQPNEKMP